MFKSAISAILSLFVLVVATPSDAKIAFTTGTIVSVFVGGAGTSAEQVTFTMSFPAQTTGCTNPYQPNQIFAFNPTDIVDAQTRKNMLAMLMSARATGSAVTVDWDDAGAYCDSSGFPIPMYVGM
jgi:hypothetical protein